MIRRFLLPVLMIFAMLLSLFGCGADSAAKNAVSDKLQSINGADITANVTATYPDRVAEYKLTYNYAKDGDGKVTVISPESISGISVTISQGSCELSFDGLRLETGELDKSGLSPLSSLPCLMSAWVGGNVAEAANSSHDGESAVLIISRHTEDNISLEYRTWFENGGQTPLYAEIYSDGNRVIQCEFERTEYK